MGVIPRTFSGTQIELLKTRAPAGRGSGSLIPFQIREARAGDHFDNTLLFPHECSITRTDNLTVCECIKEYFRTQKNEVMGRVWVGSY